MVDRLKLRSHLKSEIEEITFGQVVITEENENLALISELGLDSLDFASVMLSGETFSGVSLSEGSIDWSTVRTLDDLVELFLG